MTPTGIELQRCRIDHVEAMQADTRFAFGRHTHDHFGIGLILRGAQKSASGRGVVEAVAGDIITVNPGEVHDGSPSGNAGRAWRMLYLPPALVEGLACDISHDRAESAQEFASPIVRDAWLADQFRRLYQAMTIDDGDAGRVAADEALLILLGRLLGPSAHDRAPTARISSAKALIDDDPSATLTLATLAQEAGLSRFQFLRAFARQTGLTPHAYLMQRRVHCARRLIGQGVRPVEAAVQSGFADQSHMTRLFVRSFGMAPGAYARATA